MPFIQLTSLQPYRIRTWIRRHLPWFLIDLGLASRGKDSEKAGGEHEWYNKDGQHSACYHCQIVVAGQLWKRSN